MITLHDGVCLRHKLIHLWASALGFTDRYLSPTSTAVVSSVKSMHVLALVEFNKLAFYTFSIRMSPVTMLEHSQTRTL